MSVLRAPRDVWLWVTEPAEPRRVGAVIGVTIILGAAFTSTRDLGFWLLFGYIAALDLEERVRRSRKRRRERKQAKVIQSEATP